MNSYLEEQEKKLLKEYNAKDIDEVLAIQQKLLEAKK